MKKNRDIVFHLSILSCSAIVLGISCVFLIQATLGCDSLTTLFDGMEKQFGISLSVSNLIVNTVMFVVAFIMDKKQIGIGSVVFPIATSWGITVGMMIIPSLNSWMRIIGFILGIICLSFAIASSSKTNCGKNPYDALCFAIMERMNIKYNIVRMTIDCLLLLLGVIMGGEYGIGTIIAVITIGNIAMLFMTLLARWTWLINKLKED